MSSSTAPLRREKTIQSATSVRTTLNEQLSKLQIKQNAEVEFLEDLRSFSKQRSTIEKEYAQSLLRLTQQFMSKREIKEPPEVPGFSRTENRGLLEVWKRLLEKTEEVARARINVSEMLMSKVSEEMRQQKRLKEQAFKKYIEVAQRMSTEIQESVKEMATTKKQYSELEKVCADARQKFTESEARLKKKDTKFFESVSSLEKTHKKAVDRLKSCQKRLTVGRNEYLLAISTTNAHLRRYIGKDLPSVMQSMDGEMYSKARDAYMLYAQIEVDSASVSRAEFEDLREQAYLVHREYVLQCFLERYPVLKDVMEYEYEPNGQDQVCAIAKEHGAEIFLDKDARKWAMKLTKDNGAISEKMKQVRGLKSVTMAYTKNPEFGTSDAQAEAQLNIEALQEEVRQLSMHTVKATARLEKLRSAGIDVGKWLQKAEEKSGSQDLLSATTSLAGNHERVTSSLSLNSGSQDFDWVETASSQLDDRLSDMVSIGSNRSDGPSKYCIALFDYKAVRPDELDILIDEELEVMDWDDGDGWCKGRKKGGMEGYFPRSYVQPSSRSSSPPTVYSYGGSQDSGQLLNSNHSNGNLTMLKAMYEYTAESEEELSFPEGAVIELLKLNIDEVDDGWWKGRYEGKTGVFPSVVVEIISEGHPLDITPMNSVDIPPPADSPPPLPPNYPPPEISREDLGIDSIGPTPVSVFDVSNSPSKFRSSRTHATSPLATTPEPQNGYRSIRYSTPRRDQRTPTGDGADGSRSGSFEGSRMWRLDSFDNLDESLV